MAITIYNNDYDFNEMKKEYLEFQKEINDYDVLLGYTDNDIYEYISDMDEMNFEDTRLNLNYDIDSNIICIASLGLWNGRKRGYKLLDNNIASILKCIQGDYIKIYTDRYNLCMEDSHHDGTNYYIFRKIKPNVNIDVLLDKIYNGTDTKKDILRYTTSLKKDIKDIYGRS